MLFKFQDKLIHAGAYFVLLIFVWRYFRHFTKRPIILGFASLVFCSLYGLTDEWHQSFVPNRHADLYDWLADSIGATMGIIFLTRFNFNRLSFIN